MKRPLIAASFYFYPAILFAQAINIGQTEVRLGDDQSKVELSLKDKFNATGTEDAPSLVSPPGTKIWRLSSNKNNERLSASIWFYKNKVVLAEKTFDCAKHKNTECSTYLLNEQLTKGSKIGVGSHENASIISSIKRINEVVITEITFFLEDGRRISHLAWIDTEKETVVTSKVTEIISKLKDPPEGN